MKGLIEALTIFAKYKDLNHPTICEHDILYIVGILEDEVSEEDAEKLTALGFVWSESDDSWVSFRYGSA